MSNSKLLKIINDITTLIGGVAALSALTTVVSMKVATNRDQDLPQTNKYPCLVIAPFGQKQIPATGGTNQRRDVTYPILIVAIAADSGNTAAALDTPANWIEIITDLFDQNPKTIWPTAGVYNSTVQPLQFVDADALLANSLTAAGIVVNAQTREVRGALT